MPTASKHTKKRTGETAALDDRQRRYLIGIDGGTFGSRAALAKTTGEIVTIIGGDSLNRGVQSPAQVKRGLLRLLQLLFTVTKTTPEQLCGAVAGVTGGLQPHVRTWWYKLWTDVGPGVPLVLRGDIEIAAAATQLDSKRGDILLLLGTGAVAYSKNVEGEIVRAGGWGVRFDDEGGGYFLAKEAVKLALRALEQGEENALTYEVLEHFDSSGFSELIAAANQATIDMILPCAKLLFCPDCLKLREVKRLLDRGASAAARYVVAVAGKLPGASYKPTRVVACGGLVKRFPEYTQRCERQLKKLLGNEIQFEVWEREPVEGAVRIAERLFAAAPCNFDPLRPAERRNPASAGLDAMTSERVIELINAEDAEAVALVGLVRAGLAMVVDAAAERLRSGGRLVYVGAGTSGRLGTLDASECPPTFGISPEQVIAVMAGGSRALLHAVEGAEDDAAAGARAMRRHKVCENDIVVGIAASGTTPFVRAALREAKSRGAYTALIDCTSPLIPEYAPELDARISIPTGAEALTGSTRLKAGTATKVVLHSLTTALMVRLGKVHDNLMIDVQATNAKLRRRAARIVREVCGVDEKEAGSLLKRAKGSARRAIQECGKSGKTKQLRITN